MCFKTKYKITRLEKPHYDKINDLNYWYKLQHKFLFWWVSNGYFISYNNAVYFRDKLIHMFDK
jgi:hypothetical protein